MVRLYILLSYECFFCVRYIYFVDLLFRISFVHILFLSNFMLWLKSTYVYASELNIPHYTNADATSYCVLVCTHVRFLNRTHIRILYRHTYNNIVGKESQLLNSIEWSVRVILIYTLREVAVFEFLSFKFKALTFQIGRVSSFISFIFQS